MSRVTQVLKNKNKVEKLRKARRRAELNSLRDNSAFKAKLYDELQHLELILGDNDVDAVVIEVVGKYMNLFSTAIYSEDMAGYTVQQSESNPSQFIIKRKLVSI